MEEKEMTKCKRCNQDVPGIPDKDAPSLYYWDNSKPPAISLICYPTIEDPEQLCYYHKKIESGLIAGPWNAKGKDWTRY